MSEHEHKSFDEMMKCNRCSEFILDVKGDQAALIGKYLDRIGELKTQLAEYKFLLDKITARVMPGTTDSTDAMLEILAEKDQRIKELEDALKFYADDSLGGGAWSFRKKFMFDLICESDLEYIGEPCGKKGQRYILGGKRARKALGSANAESEG